MHPDIQELTNRFLEDFREKIGSEGLSPLVPVAQALGKISATIMVGAIQGNIPEGQIKAELDRALAGIPSIPQRQRWRNAFCLTMQGRLQAAQGLMGRLLYSWKSGV